jgi:hypothetical protein
MRFSIHNWSWICHPGPVESLEAVKAVLAGLAACLQRDLRQVAPELFLLASPFRERQAGAGNHAYLECHRMHDLLCLGGVPDDDWSVRATET